MDWRVRNRIWSHRVRKTYGCTGEPDFFCRHCVRGVHFVFGIWLGTRIGRSRERISARILCERIQFMAQQLASMASNVGSDVRLYNGQISDFQVQVNGIRNAREKRSSLLNYVSMGQAEDDVALLLHAILQVNEGMKQRLDETEARLESHAQGM